MKLENKLGLLGSFIKDWPLEEGSRRQLEIHPLCSYCFTGGHGTSAISNLSLSPPVQATRFLSLDSPWQSSCVDWVPPTTSFGLTLPLNQTDFLRDSFFRLTVLRADQGLSIFPVLGIDCSLHTTHLQQWKWLVALRQACSWPCTGIFNCLASGRW